MGIAKRFLKLCNEINNDPFGKGYANMSDQEVADSLNEPFVENVLVPADKVIEWATKYRLLKRLEDAGMKDSVQYKEAELVFTGNLQMVDVTNPGAQAMINDLIKAGVLSQEEAGELLAMGQRETTRAKQLGYNRPIVPAWVANCRGGK